MESEGREADHTEDPRGTDVGDGGYPETGQPGTSSSEDTDRREDTGAGEEAPDTSSPDEGDPGQATGNPDAAGG